MGAKRALDCWTNLNSVPPARLCHNSLTPIKRVGSPEPVVHLLWKRALRCQRGASLSHHYNGTTPELRRPTTPAQPEGLKPLNLGGFRSGSVAVLAAAGLSGAGQSAFLGLVLRIVDAIATSHSTNPDSSPSPLNTPRRRWPPGDVCACLLSTSRYRGSALRGHVGVDQVWTDRGRSTAPVPPLGIVPESHPLRPGGRLSTDLALTASGSIVTDAYTLYHCMHGVDMHVADYNKNEFVADEFREDLDDLLQSPTFSRAWLFWFFQRRSIRRRPACQGNGSISAHQHRRMFLYHACQW